MPAFQVAQKARNTHLIYLAASYGGRAKVVSYHCRSRNIQSWIGSSVENFNFHVKLYSVWYSLQHNLCYTNYSAIKVGYFYVSAKESRLLRQKRAISGPIFVKSCYHTFETPSHQAGATVPDYWWHPLINDWWACRDQNFQICNVWFATLLSNKRSTHFSVHMHYTRKRSWVVDTHALKIIFPTTF